MKNKNGKKVFLGLSGGVDSSVAAALLKEKGFDVIGVFIKGWHPEFFDCPWKEERRDAIRVAATLEIPFLTMDLAKEYYDHVAQYMINEYKEGRTPNPDVMCNKEIKFGYFFQKAIAMGADYIATGHYAQNIDNMLTRSKDEEKDQTYFLWNLTQDILQKTLFPVGEYTKDEVRILAQKHGLPTSDKKDSQGICFIGNVSMKDFLMHFIPKKTGDVLNTAGDIIGTHDGAVYYTPGQRHGFKISKKTAEETPYYVISKDVKANTLVVAKDVSNKTLNQKSNKTIELEKINWIEVEPKEGREYQCRYRHRQKLITCKLSKNNTTYTVHFDEPQNFVASGQSLVVYDGKKCLGGGVVPD